MRKLKLRKWVKYAMILTLIVIVISILIHLICKKISDIEEVAKKCDKEYGHICSQYELKNFILRGDNYGK